MIDCFFVFKCDYKCEVKGQYCVMFDDVFKLVLVVLVIDQFFDVCYCDYDFFGDWVGYCECYIKFDLLLIYCKFDFDILCLVWFGLYSEFFG